MKKEIFISLEFDKEYNQALRNPPTVTTAYSLFSQLMFHNDFDRLERLESIFVDYINGGKYNRVDAEKLKQILDKVYDKLNSRS